MALPLQTINLLLVLLPLQLVAQFREDFNGAPAELSGNGIAGWNAITGDGEGLFTQGVQQGNAILQLDARQDKRNIWYAFIHRDVSTPLDVKKLNKPGYGLRIQARVKPSHSPRRVNMYIKSLSTNNDFLREFDLAEKDKWYEISMTTDKFRHEPGKPLLAQVSFMDWGNTDIYSLEIDHIQVDVVKLAEAGPDKGTPIPYRPPLAEAKEFTVEHKATSDVTVDKQYPTLNLSTLVDNHTPARQILMVDGSKIAVLAWDFGNSKNKKVRGPGQLEFYTHSLYNLATNPKDFGEVRICEIIGGTSNWKENEITYQQLLQGLPQSAVINEQTIVDVAIKPGEGSKTTVTLSQPVTQRLLDGKTLGIAIMPLGLISAVLMDSGVNNGQYAARLRMNLEE